MTAYEICHHTLGLRLGADRGAIRRAFLALARRYHPDFLGRDDGRFRSARAAYEHLVDAAKQQPTGSSIASADADRTELVVRLEDALHGCRWRLRRGHTLSAVQWLPAGTAEGTELRVVDRALGVAQVRVRFARHPRFAHRGADLACTLELSPELAREGGACWVPLLDGRARLRVPAETRAGDCWRLRGHGLPKRDGERGDLLVEICMGTAGEWSARGKPPSWSSTEAGRVRIGATTRP